MKYLRMIALLGGLLFTPLHAEANIGLPMILIIAPDMLIALIPIILIESYIMSKQLTLAFIPSLKAASWGNIISTVIGIPITWAVLVAIQIATGGEKSYGLNSPINKFLAVTWQSPWLMPYKKEFHWMVPAAALFLLVPFFFVSWWIEYEIEKRVMKNIDHSQIKRAVRNANLVSYGILALIVLGFLITAKLEM